ncbi:unnamed protein product [Discosporangium mesarthrocarpum]
MTRDRKTNVSQTLQILPPPRLTGQCLDEDVGMCGALDGPEYTGGQEVQEILAVLQILGRESYFDDIEIASGIAESAIQAVFHAFRKNSAKDMYETWNFALMGDDLKKVTDTFGKLGFPGAAGFTDVAHIRWDNAPASHDTHHRGQEDYPSIAYQVTVDRSGRPLAVTEGFAGANNDKAIIHFDSSVTESNSGFTRKGVH